MKVFKKAAALILCMILVLSLAGCVPGSQGGAENIFLWPFKAVESLRDKAADVSEELADKIRDFRDNAGGQKAEEPDVSGEVKPENEQEPGLSGGIKPEKEQEPQQEENAPEQKAQPVPDEEKEKPEKTETAHGTEDKESAFGSFMPEYYHYDKADFEKLVQNLKDAAEAGDEQALEEAYEAGYQEIVKLDDLYSSIYLKYSDDVTNKENDEEMNYTRGVLIDCEDQFCTALHEILESGENDEFQDYLGEKRTKYFLDYLPMTAEVKDLYDQVIDLETDYYEEYNRLDEYTYEYNGREWTLDDLNDEDQALEFAETDPQGYLSAHDGILKNFNEKVGEIFLQIVALNNQIAEYYGYDNYAEYAYKEVYERDYTVEDAAEYCEVIKQSVAPKYYNYVYYGGAFSDDIDYESTADGLISSLGELSGKISPVAEKAFQLLSEEKLYDIGYEKNRIESSYTSYLSAAGVPYIFAHLTDGTYDLLTMTHEFGHFSYFSQLESYDYFLNSFDLDLMEMHSNGYELLCTKFYDDYFGPQADDALKYCLAQVLANVVDGCLQDEFQRRVYAEEDLDLEKVNRIYTEVAESYGARSQGSENYEWCMIPHTFESPFYYLSYSVSALTALEIWDISQEDYDKGVEAWENLVAYTGDHEGYFRTLEKCGLSPITDTERITEICGVALEKFGATDLYNQYDLEQWLKELMEGF